MTRIQINCSIADDLKKRLQDRIFGPVQKQRTLATLVGPVTLCIDSILQLNWCITGHRTTNVFFFVVVLVFALGLIGFWFALPKLPRRWPYATQIAIAIDDAGIAGTFDGKTASFRWHDVTSIEDIDDAFMLYFGEGPFARRLVIPKYALPDPASLWSELDDRLVSKRGLTGPRSNRRIVNTAFA